VKLYIYQSFFEFSIAQTTIDMWKSGARSLALIIGIFSGLWPYTKQSITMFLWFMPTTRINARTRGFLFVWLDTFAKWSTIDIYILIITIVAFRISIVSPPRLQGNYYDLDLQVIPLWGLYANMIAQLVSQISSHIIIYYHKRVLQEIKSNAQKNETHMNGTQVELGNQECMVEEKKERVCNHLFARSNFHNRRMRITQLGNILICVISLLSILFLILGCTLASFKLEIFGLMGVIIEAGNQEEAIINHSIFSIVGLILDEAKSINSTAQYVGLGFLSFLLVLTSVVVPISLAVTLLFIWFVPMKRRAIENALVAVEILKAWQYLEVYIIAIVIASWQLGGVSEFLFNDAYCTDFRQQFSLLTYYGFLDVKDAQCFYNQASVEMGTLYLILSSILLSLLSGIVVAATKQKHEEDDENKNDLIIYDDMNKKLPNSVLDELRVPTPNFVHKYGLFLCPATSR